jgi:hypothetical protein
MRPPYECREERVEEGLPSPSDCMMPLAPGVRPHVPQGWWTGKMGE